MVSACVDFVEKHVKKTSLKNVKHVKMKKDTAYGEMCCSRRCFKMTSQKRHLSRQLFLRKFEKLKEGGKERGKKRGSRQALIHPKCRSPAPAGRNTGKSVELRNSTAIVKRITHLIAFDIGDVHMFSWI